jgi:hypothetical protein
MAFALCSNVERQYNRCVVEDDQAEEPCHGRLWRRVIAGLAVPETLVAIKLFV